MKRACTVIALTLILSATTFAQVTPAPPLMNFQGRLAKPDGSPVADSTYTLTLSLWNDPVSTLAASQLWTETIPNVPVKNGVFATLLGDRSPLPSTLFNNNVWLQVQIRNDVPLLPRQQVVTVAYAFKANTVPDGTITTAKIANGAVNAAKLSDSVLNLTGDLTGTLTNPQLATLPTSLFKVSGGVMTSSNGRIGIGTTNPLTGLHINGSVGLTSSIGASTPRPALSTTPFSGEIRALSSNVGGDDGFMRLSAGGGTNPFVQSFIDLSGYASSDLPERVCNIRFGTFGTEQMRITLQGNVGIGTATPSYRLQVNGSVAGIGPYFDASDGRLKQNIKPVQNALNTVLELCGVTYDWNQAAFPKMRFPHGRQIGFIAQDVEKILPQVVSRDAEGRYAVAYSHIVPVLVEAIKAQQKKINALEKQTADVANLKAQVAELAAAMREMKAQQDTVRNSQK